MDLYFHSLYICFPSAIISHRGNFVGKLQRKIKRSKQFIFINALKLLVFRKFFCLFPI